MQVLSWKYDIMLSEIYNLMDGSKVKDRTHEESCISLGLIYYKYRNCHSQK